MPCQTGSFCVYIGGEMLGAMHAKGTLTSTYSRCIVQIEQIFLVLDTLGCTRISGDGGASCCCLHVCGGVGPWRACSHSGSGSVHRRVLRRERQWSALAGRRGAALQVQRHHRHAHLLPRRQHPAGPRRQQPRRHPRRRQRPALQPRRQRLQRGLLGAGQRAASRGRQHQVHRRRQRGSRPRWQHAGRPPGHAERARRAGQGRPRRHQGVHGGELGRHRRVPSLPGHLLHLRLPHAAHRAVPRHHRLAAARQRVPLLRLHGHARDRPQLRPLHGVGHGGARRRQRQGLPEPVRRARGHDVLRARERRGRERRHRGVRERVAVGRRHAGDHRQRADVQPEPDQPCRTGNTQEARGDRGVHIRHVQRGPEDWS